MIDNPKEVTTEYYTLKFFALCRQMKQTLFFFSLTQMQIKQKRH